MRKIWILVIILAIATVVTLAYTWQNIPILNDLIWDLNIGVQIENLTSGVNSFISNPLTIVPSLGGISVIGGIIFKYMKGKLDKSNKTNVLQNIDHQNLTGDLKNLVSTAQSQVSSMTKEKDGFLLKITELENQLREQAETYANIDNVLQAKDDAIKKLRDQTDSLHAVIKNMKLGDGEIIEKIVVT